MKKCFTSVLYAFLLFTAAHAQKNIKSSLLIGDVEREYIIHLPTSYSIEKKLPLVLIFHGGGGNAKQMQGYMGMDSIADRKNFICVYPQGINKQWNDGREFKESISANDDVRFISVLLDSLGKQYAIDKSRIFSTGISNGAFFSICLADKLADRILAIAPVCGSIPEKTFDAFSPAMPISLLLINGTSDPLVPYNGGSVGNRLIGNRGNCTSTDKTIEKFISIDQVNKTATITELPDNDGSDGCSATQYSYAGGKNKTSVVLVKITGGGHTLPGAAQYLPKFIVGKVCRDFEANAMIWNFFASCKPR
jgi:polyhydroxybutyrate depolymerase